jgi:repressor LexA
MTPHQLKCIRQDLGLTQAELAKKVRTTLTTIGRYECGDRRIPDMLEVALASLMNSRYIPMAGVVQAGKPVEPFPQYEEAEIPSTMIGQGDHVVLLVKGESMRDEGILPGDLIVVKKTDAVRNGQTVVALVNQEATVKKYYKRKAHIELHPANAAMEPIIVSPTDDFHIQGIMVGLLRHCQT